MTQRAHRFLPVILAASAFFGCGGRTPDENNPGDGTNPGAPPPTCAEICSHIIGSCAPGASTDPCTRDCEQRTATFANCDKLDPYLRCMPSVKVKCTATEAIIEGCDMERNALNSCTP
jgi:hypothetical protein